jgi:beta-galactosidase
MELAVRGGTTVYVAHDDRLQRPDWLTRQFRPTGESLQVDGHPMRLFARRAEADQSLTLGTNTENAAARAGNMYIVFVNEQR